MVLQCAQSSDSRRAFIEEELDQLMKVVGTKLSQWRDLIVVDWARVDLGCLQINAPRHETFWCQSDLDGSASSLGCHRSIRAMCRLATRLP